MSLRRSDEALGSDHPKLLLVEGQEDQHVLLQLLTKHLGITDIEIRETEGAGNLSGYLDMLPSLPGYETLTTVAVLQDSDETPAKAFAAVRKTLEAHYPQVPETSGSFIGDSPRVGALVLGDGEGKCTLEHVCLASAKTNAQCLPCVDAYLECLRQCPDIRLHPNEAKHRAHAFLASLPDPSRNLGQAASDGHWNFDHPAWEPIKQFLKSM